MDSADQKRLSQLSASSATKRTKSHVGPWRLGRTLGRGSSGRVRLAKHTVTGQLAAVKIVPKSVAHGISTSDQDISAASANASQANHERAPYGIEREVIIMKLIEHPNVMALYDVWENKGELYVSLSTFFCPSNMITNHLLSYLVLEYIEGGELFDYLIKKGRLEEREAVHYFRQIIHGVDYCHRFNICHRDLKPENLLLDKHRNIKIADFGMAALETSDKMLETSCGSPHYASPEIVAGKSYHGSSSDIWSCGIILFALLTGHLPFDDDNIRKLLLKVQEGKFQMPPELSPHAKDLIWKMLRVDPNTRITMPDILKHSLLRKYPAKRSAPRPSHPISTEMLSRPVKSLQQVDPEILKNLQTLWHGADKDTVLKNLLSDEPNSEKTFYCLLMKYRHDHNDDLSSKKKAIGASPSGMAASSSGLASPRSHRRSASATSSIHKKSKPSRSHSRSLSRGHSRSHSRQKVVYHSRSGSKSSIKSSASSKRRHHKRNGSTASSKAASPPPPLPTEAIRIVEAERARVAKDAFHEKKISTRQSEWTQKSSSDFASMLEQAFHFDTSANYHPPPLAKQQMGIASSEPARQYSNEPPPVLSASPMPSLGASPSDAPATPPLADVPTGVPGELLLPMIFEEDRFADAVEEEMDLHLKRSLDTPLAKSVKSRNSDTLKRSPYNPDETFSSDLYKSLHLPSIPDTPIYDDASLKQLRANQMQYHDDSFANDSVEHSRLRISGLLKTESFKTRTASGSGSRPKSVEPPQVPDYQRSPPFNYNTAKFGMASPAFQQKSTQPQPQPQARPQQSQEQQQQQKQKHQQLQQPATKSHHHARYSEPTPNAKKETSGNERPRAVSANAAMEYPRIITSADSKPVPVSGSDAGTEMARNATRGTSLLRKFTLVPKRAAPAAPAAEQQRVVSSSAQSRVVSRSSEAPKSRVVSGASNADTVATTSTWQSRQSRQSTATADTEYSNSTFSSSGGAGISSALSGPKQNWFMKILNTTKTETKGYYSALAAPVLRKIIVQILQDWRQYGISNISEDVTTSTIRAKISSSNVLSLRSSKFRIEIESHSVRSSYYNHYLKPQYLASAGGGNGQMVTSIVIVQERGSTNSFLRFLGEMEKALEENNALIKSAEHEDERNRPTEATMAAASSLGIYV